MGVLYPPPSGWVDAAWLWAYALTWFVINDAVKMATYRLLRQHNIDV